MTKDNEKPLPVATVALDPRSRAALDMVFKGPGKGAYALVDEAVAAVTIVDLDGAEALTLWKEYKERHPHRPVIVLSVRKETVPGAAFLQKPLRINGLLEVLDGLRRDLRTGSHRPRQVTLSSDELTPAASSQEVRGAALTILGAALAEHAATPRVAPTPRSATRAMEKHAVASYETFLPEAAKVDLRDPQKFEHLFFTAEDYLGGQLLQVAADAKQDRLAREIRVWNGRIVLLPEADQACTDLSDMRLKQLSLFRRPEHGRSVADGTPVDAKITRLRGDSQIGKAIADPDGKLTTVPVDSFIWKLTAWVSRGRVPAGTHLAMPVVMIHWPNMTRLLMTPNALRIAALWAAEPRSLLNTAKSLGIPLSHVFTMYSAANAIGLITPPKRQVDFLFQPQQVREHHGRGLFRRILDKLTGLQ